MTDARPRSPTGTLGRRRPASAARVLVAGGSVAATLVLVTSMAVAAPQAQPDAPALRVVLTDPRIDPAEAIPAAVEAARAGRGTIQVPVAAAPAPARPGDTRAPHTATRSS